MVTLDENDCSSLSFAALEKMKGENMKASDFLNQFNLTINQAYDYILSNLGNPQGLFTTLKSVGAGTSIIAEIVKSKIDTITVDDVKKFFLDNNLNPQELDDAYFNLIRTKYAPTTYSGMSDNIEGTEADDNIDGGFGNDTIKGLEGDDILIGNSGNDEIYGGYGADYLEGGLGSDYLDAGREYTYHYTNGYYDGNRWIPSKYWYEYDLSTNILVGGSGDDTLIGGYGADRLDGEIGADRIYGNEGDDSIDGGSGDDQLNGNDGNDSIIGGAGNDTIYGESGSDSIVGGTGDDSINTSDYYYDDQNAYSDRIFANEGNDKIYADNSDEIDAGEGDDDIGIHFTSRAPMPGVVKPGEGVDRVTFYVSTGEPVVLDLSETSQEHLRLCEQL